MAHEPTFRGFDVLWVAAGAGGTRVQGAVEVVVLAAGQRQLDDALLVVEPATQRHPTPLHLRARLLAHKTCVTACEHKTCVTACRTKHV